jgi:aspartyl-tRNA(Asn)/glutamyl-tRNA(Gln) amidotransferase subunit C
VSLSRAEVRHVALLARLGLEPGEEEYYAEQLSKILDHIQRISELDTDRIPPTASVLPLSNVMRDDAVRDCLPRESVLDNAPEAADGYFVVKAIQDLESE